MTKESCNLDLIVSHPLCVGCFKIAFFAQIKFWICNMGSDRKLSLPTGSDENKLSAEQQSESDEVT